MTSVHQSGTGPNLKSSERTFGQNALGSELSFLGSRKGTKQIQLRTTFVDEADRAQNSIDDAIRAEAIDIHGWKKCALHKEFFVVHAAVPQHNQPRYQTTSRADSKNKNARDHQIRFRAALMFHFGNCAPHYQSIDGAQA
jgi:hypothetical protein